MEETHDLAGDSEVSVTDHFGGGCDVEVDFVEVFYLFSASETDAVRLCLGDSSFVVSFIHDMLG